MNAYKRLMRDCNRFTDKQERKLIRKAFELAEAAHRPQRRKSGEPYILHPLEVARIVVREIGLWDYEAVIAALLHDTVEDTYVTLEELENTFGKTVADIVDGLTKISGVFDLTTTSQQAETFRKMLLTLSEDIRVALIKISDRLHNLRTLGAMSRKSQLKIAAETEMLYAPLAHRFGLYNLKSEMEDYILKYTEPEVYDDIERKLEASKTDRDRYIKSFIRPLKQKMARNGLKTKIKGRVKSVSSIYRKMKRQNIPFEQVYDLFAVRIIIEEEPDWDEEKQKDVCWKAYNAITATYKPHPDRLRDWISQPRASGYQSLHTTVLGPQGRWVEVQIRTSAMDYVAEKGLASHWRYKENATTQQDKIFDQWLAKVRDLLESRETNAKDFVQEVRNALVVEQIYVFTPKGELKILPKGASALDFAYLIHTNVGNTCIGAKVNQRLVSRGHVLQNGDHVEILTSGKQAPEDDWLKFVKTSRARNKIKEALKEQHRSLAQKGKEIFNWKARQLGVTENHQAVREILAEMHLPTLFDFYYQIGTHQIDLRKLSELIERKLQRREDYEQYPTSEAYAQFKQEEFEDFLQRTLGVESDQLIVNPEYNTSNYQLAECCNPIPGDEIIGFVDPEEGIIVHRTNCIEARELMSSFGSKMVKVNWSEDNYVEFLAGVRVTGQDTKGMMNKLVRVVSLKSSLNIRSITIDSKNGAFQGDFLVYVTNAKQLDSLIKNLLEVKGVHGATRIKAQA